MSPVRHGRGRHASIRSLCCSLCVLSTWVHSSIALPQGALTSDGSVDTVSSDAALIPSIQKITSLAPTETTQNLIPSQPPLGLIPSRPLGLIPSQPPVGIIPSQPPQGLIPSQPPQGIIPSQPPHGIIPSEPPPQGLIPSQPPGVIPSQPPGVIPSQPPGVIPSQPPGVIPSQSPGVIPSQPPGVIPSQPPFEIRSSQTAPGVIPSGPPLSEVIPSGPAPSGLIPTGPPLTSGTHLQPGVTSIPTQVVTTIPHSYGNFTNGPPYIANLTSSTREPLIPIPGQSTKTGNPNGRQETTAPNLTASGTCKNCSPIFEIPATGFFDDIHSNPPAIPGPGPSPTSNPPIKATITPGPKPIIIVNDPVKDPDNFVVGGSTTVKAGETVIVDDTPIVIRTSSGTAEVIVYGSATSTVVFVTQNVPAAAPAHVAQSQITEAPLLVPVTIGHQTLTPNSNSQFVLSGQTLLPGGPAITVDGTTVSLAPSATAIVVNGVTSTLNRVYGAIYTTTTAPYLTIANRVFTANRAGYYSLAPGVTLIPGGAPVTVFGTTISLEPQGRTAIIQGSTSALAPVTTVVTITRPGGAGGGNTGEHATSDGGVWLPLPTGGSGAVGSMRISGLFISGGWLEGGFLIGVVSLGWLAVWL